LLIRLPPLLFQILQEDIVVPLPHP
jgi:hypothetical protein